MPATLPDFPLRLASAEAFGRVRAFFRASNYDEPTLCRVLGLENMSALGRVDWDRVAVQPAALAWCVRVFARGLLTETALAAEICGPDVQDALFELGLLQPAKKTPASLLCPVWLYPLAEFIIASDRRDDPEDAAFTPAADVVFPAIYGGTLRFLQLLPETHGAALDLCGGSGIGALQLSRTARISVTADLAERSAVFAEFNARLNSRPVESLSGDLYAPVPGRQFDFISAHPPFVPATGPNMVYRDGGDSGEEVTRGVVAGLPAHLRAGGDCVILCVARDTAKQTFEQRVREWLGDRRDEFEIVFGLEKILSVEEVVDSLRKRGQNVTPAEARSLLTRLQSLETRQFVYGALFIRRHAGRVAAEPLRVHLTPRGKAADFERLLAWREFCRQPDFLAGLARSRPQPATELVLTARHVVQAGELVPAEFVFSIEAGFAAALRPDAWVVPLVARLNGQRSVAEVFSAAQHAGELPDGFTLESFLGLVQRLLELGLFRS